MDQTKQQSNIPILAKALGFVIFIAIWLVVGGIATLAPLIIHNLEKYVGVLTLNIVFYSWLIMPFTFSLYFFSSHKFAFLPFSFNAIIWFIFYILLLQRAP